MHNHVPLAPRKTRTLEAVTSDSDSLDWAHRYKRCQIGPVAGGRSCNPEDFIGVPVVCITGHSWIAETGDNRFLRSLQSARVER